MQYSFNESRKCNALTLVKSIVTILRTHVIHIIPNANCKPLQGPVYTALHLYKSGEKNIHYCKTVHTDPRKNGGFKNALKSEYLQNGGL